ncbi:MAG: cytochrome b [Candidatus Methylopumilus sp.]|jgi:cytochrome b561|nr:cytochrome b [Candidatus Methylopumilus sp.]
MSTQRYTKTAIILHWLIGALIVFMFLLGWYMTELPKDADKVMSFDLFDLGIAQWNVAQEMSPRTFYFNLHKSLGVTILALVLFRIYWRLSHRPPALLSSLKAWERKLAAGGHHSLYLLMVLIPVAGIIMSLYSKYGLQWFGIKLLEGLDNKDLRETFAEVHELLGTAMLVVLAVHVLGALKHRLIDKDDTMKRMSLRK